MRGEQVATHECYIVMLEMNDHLQALNIEEKKGHYRTHGGSGRNLLR